ncbi:hypothetical protein Pan153_22050 [Gimesia panareensis]|uniref:Uncharacterized protein n=1 Tax=Gimesia panareensis TaxID=2527978 RepID=A0A518FMG6_9PLAN|nr:hypothetical protein Pan153_22050 [Gimesia panareensis]
MAKRFIWLAISILYNTHQLRLMLTGLIWLNSLRIHNREGYKSYLYFSVSCHPFNSVWSVPFVRIGGPAWRATVST